MPSVPNAIPAATAQADVAPFPEGSRIIHIGPPKTGTSALQDACRAAKARMLEQGVRYAGPATHHSMPARAVTGLATISGRPHVPPIGRWTELLEEMRGARELRVLYSSEVFAEASEASIRRIATDVGPDIQVLITLRPLDSILASQWQQSVQHGAVLTLDEYLVRVLGEDAHPPVDTGALRVFRHGDLVERWAAVVGSDRVTVVILDRRDPGFLLRNAEALLGLRPGTLQAAHIPANRSLTMAEAEVIRHLNRHAGAARLPAATRLRLVKSGAAAYAKRHPPAPDAVSIRLPTWAAARAGELGREASEAIRASSVRVIGDVGQLATEPSEPPVQAAGPRDAWVDPGTAAVMAMGMAWGTGLELGADQPVAPDDWALKHISSRMLGRELVRRVGRRLRRIGERFGRPEEPEQRVEPPPMAR
jgi:hypothetical protein